MVYFHYTRERGESLHSKERRSPGNKLLLRNCIPEEEEEEEQKELVVFNDTTEGPRAPAVKPGRITQA